MVFEMTAEIAVQAVFILMMLGFVVITGWIHSEMTWIKYAIAQILAANPKVAKEVEKFIKKKDVLEVKEDGTTEQKD